jgi:hypothetical protein
MVSGMHTFVVNAKRVLWDFVEIAFLIVLSLLLVSLLLGTDAGTYVTSVAENVSAFASKASSGLLGIVIVLAIAYLALRRTTGAPKT